MASFHFTDAHRGADDHRRSDDLLRGALGGGGGPRRGTAQLAIFDRRTLSTRRDGNKSGAGAASEALEVEGARKLPDNVEMTNAPTPVALPATRLRWSRADSETALLVLILKGLVLFLAALGIQTLFDQKETWATLWTRWDASHYLSLAKDGYTATGDGRFSIVFYPLYPWLVRAVAFVCRSYFAAALLVSGVASICARPSSAPVSGAGSAGDCGADGGLVPVHFSDRVLFAHRLHRELVPRPRAGVLAGGAEASLGDSRRARSARLHDPRKRASARAHSDGGRLVAISADAPDRLALALDRSSGLGFLAYLFLNYRVTGDPFAFSPIMEEHWYKKIAPPWVGISEAWSRIFRFNLTEGLFEFVFICFSFLCTVWCWLALRPTYAVWMTLNWLLITSTTFLVSVPRYCLTLFPIFIILARLAAARPLAGRIVTATSLFLLALFAMKFAHGTWAF